MTFALLVELVEKRRNLYKSLPGLYPANWTQTHQRELHHYFSSLFQSVTNDTLWPFLLARLTDEVLVVITDRYIKLTFLST